MTTVLELVQDFTDKAGLPRPTALVGVTETTVRQFRALLQELAEDLRQYKWPEQRVRKTWTSVTGADQGTFVSIFGTDFDALVPGTLWNNTRVMQITGPVTDTTWQSFQALPNAGPEYRFWNAGGKLLVSPALVAGDNLSAIYVTKNIIVAVDGITTKARITADDDAFLLPDEVVKRGIEYKWRKAQGEPGWEDDYNAFIAGLAKSVTKTGLPTLSLTPGCAEIRPSITIPTGSWNV